MLPEHWKPQLKAVSLEISSIQYECHTWNVPKTRYLGGYIKFTGVYKPGSAGTEDAKFIQWRINEFADLMRLSGLIVDFRELNYVWGDDLDAYPETLTGRPVLYLVPKPEHNAEVYEAYKWALEEHNIRTNFLETFRDLVAQFAVEKRETRSRTISVDISLDSDLFTSPDELKRFHQIQEHILERGIGQFESYGVIDFAFRVNPDKDMETAVEMVKALLEEHGISLETVKIHVRGI